MVDQKKSKTEKTEQSKKENIIQTTDDKKGEKHELFKENKY